MSHPAEPPVRSSHAPGKLAAGKLGLWELIIMGIAGTAPAFSIEVTASTLIGALGVLSVASIFYSGIIMFGITLAYIHLTKHNAHAGAAYAWVGEAFGKSWGFFAGWALLVASALFMVSGTIPAANAFLLIFAPSLKNNVPAIAIVAGLIFTAISLVVMKGIKLTSYVQVAFTIIEIMILTVLVGAGYVIFTRDMAHPFSMDWFSFSGMSVKSFADGALISMFFYWGWDVVMNLNEEAKDASKTAGRGALWAMIYLIAFFILFMVLILIGLPDATIQEYNTNVIYALGEKLWGNVFGFAAIIAVLLSTIGTLETQILQFTRTLFAQSRDKALHPRWATVHAKWQTPHYAVLAIWVFGIALIALSSMIPTVQEILQTFISAIGFQIAFYLGLAGLACAWIFRKKLNESVGAALSYVIWPAASACFLFFIAVYMVPTFDLKTNILGIGSIVVGIVPLMMSKWRNKRV